jgi:hypothetical protein
MTRSSATSGSPLELEHRFQALKQNLQYPSSARTKLRLLEEFLALALSTPQAAEPYLLEILQRVPVMVSGAAFDGAPATTIQSLVSSLEKSSHEIPSLRSIRGFEEAIARLRFAALLGYAFAGNTRTVLELLNRQSSYPRPGITGFDEKSDDAPRLRLRNLRSALEPGDELVQGLREIEEVWDQHLVQQGLVAYVPVIEKSMAPQHAGVQEGGLRRITLTILGGSPDGKDSIHTDVAVFGADLSWIIEAPLNAARLLFEDVNPHAGNTFLNAQLSFAQRDALHEGLSANLAIAALLYCALQEQAQARERPALLPAVCITGNVDRFGSVLPIGTDGLEGKVRAAFNSWMEVLVVPREQLPAAEQIARGLSKSSPGRSLTILGVGHLRDMFYDRRISSVQRLSYIRHTAMKVWRHRRSLSVLAFAALIGTIVGMAMWPFDRNPVAYAFEGEKLLLRNQYGHLIERVDVGNRTVLAFTEHELLNVRRSPVVFADVDGDGRNEIFWLQYESGKLDHGMEVRCRGIGEKQDRWIYPLRREIRFPSSSDVADDCFRSSQLLIAHTNSDDSFDLFVNAKHTAFPGLLVRLDARSGNERGSYVHIGHLLDMTVCDLDGDGRNELVACGVNNAYREACLVVLDPRAMAGHSPATPEYEPVNLAPGTEKAYIRIPRTLVGEAYALRAKYNIAFGVSASQAAHTISLALQDVWIISDRSEETRTAWLGMQFGFDFRLKAITSGDDYDVVYDDLIRKGTIPAVPRNAYLKSFGQNVKYWDGFSWGSKP